jgi:hypothetical protein
MRTVLWGLAWITLIGSAALAFAVWRGDESYGISDFWEAVIGDPDLGEVDFAAVSRSPTGNDALFCPPGVCGQTRVDGVSPIFNAPVSRLRDAVRVIEANDENLVQVEAETPGVQDRYVSRSRLMRYPDTINVRFYDLGDGRSSLALHSRSQIGRSDFGVNKARLDSWLAELRRQLPVAS